MDEYDHDGKFDAYTSFYYLTFPEDGRLRLLIEYYDTILDRNTPKQNKKQKILNAYYNTTFDDSI